MRKIRVTAGNASSMFTLLDEMAPNSAQALWATLPIEAQLTHGRWAGSAVWTKTPRPPLSDIDGNEVPVTSLYPGMMFVRKGPRGLGEILISYGEAEARAFDGRGYATPMAMIDGPREAFFGGLRRSWFEGSLPITIEPVTE